MTDPVGGQLPNATSDAERETSPSRENGSSIIRIALLTVVAPLAYPAWGIEYIVRKRHRDFEFRIFSSIPYFLAVTVISVVVLLAFPEIAVQALALYFLGMMELISLTTCAVIAIARAGRLQNLVRVVARRRFRAQLVAANSATISATVISAFYSVLFFGALSYVLWEANSSFFTGTPESSRRIYDFWQFIQSSFLVVINNGDTLIAVRFASQLIWDFERLIGIFLLVFLLAVLASGWAEHAIRDAFPDAGRERDVDADRPRSN